MSRRPANRLLAPTPDGEPARHREDNDGYRQVRREGGVRRREHPLEATHNSAWLMVSLCRSLGLRLDHDPVSTTEFGRHLFGRQTPQNLVRGGLHWR